MKAIKFCGQVAARWAVFKEKLNFKNKISVNYILKCQDSVLRSPPHSTYTMKNTSSLICEQSSPRYDNYSWKIYFGITLLSSSIALFYVFCSDDEKNKNLFKAAKTGDAKTIQKLVAEGFNVNLHHRLGWTALHVAAVNGNVEIVQALLDAGADPNLGDEFTNAKKMAKVKHLNSDDILEIREGEFSDIFNKEFICYGLTALHYAAIAEKTETMKLLLQRGADLTIETEMGIHPKDYADEKIRELLLQYAAKFKEMKIKKGGRESRRFSLEQKIRQHIVGQDGPIITVTSSICRKENGWSNNERPIVFLFLGSSGVGKTELAKQLAKYVCKGTPGSFIRLDMSEYQEKHEISKLIGSPPSYVGYEEGGQLTEQLKKCPSAVVLFDEVDKAHSDVLTVLLQIFDEGRITDGMGYTIDCRNAIFIMTANLACDKMEAYGVKLHREIGGITNKILESNEDNIPKKFEISLGFREKVIYPILKKHFQRDEFIGRINEIVYFTPPSYSEVKKLVAKELQFWANKAKEMHKIELLWDDEVESILIEGYDVRFGVRSIKNYVEHKIINQLAAAHDLGIIKNGSTVRLVVQWPISELEGVYVKMLSKAKGVKDFVEIDEEVLYEK